MEIKKGDWFRCIKDVNDLYSKNKVYLSDRDGSLNTIQGWGCLICESHFNHFKKLYTIQDLKDGIVAVANDGTVDELNKVLLTSFPEDIKSYGAHRYYYENDGEWLASDDVSLPTQSVKDFLIQLPKEKEETWEPKVGEIVEFNSDTSTVVWRRGEYLATDKKSVNPYALSYTSRTGMRLIVTSTEIRQMPKKIKVTKQEIADKMGIELNQLEII